MPINMTGIRASSFFKILFARLLNQSAFHDFDTKEWSLKVQLHQILARARE
jgi:hypothetical protein